MKKQTTHVRRKNRIRDLEQGRTVKFESVNKAKKWSRLHQLKNGGLGCGVVKVSR